MKNQIFWLKFGIIILFFIIIQIRAQNVEQDQGQDQGPTQGQEQPQGQQTQEQTQGETQNQETIPQDVVGDTQPNQTQNQETQNFGPDSPLEIVEILYCKHFNYTESDKEKLEFRLSKNKISEYKNIVFKYLDPKIMLKDSNVLDYYIRFLLLSEGLCYFEDDRNLKAITDFLDPLDIERPSNDTSPIKFTTYIRYAKTINCYMYYSDAIFEEDRQNFESKTKKPCYHQCYEYYEAISSFIYDETLCPSLPENPKYRTIIEPGLTTENYKQNYISKLIQFCKSIENEEQCQDETNLEVVNCGKYIQMNNKIKKKSIIIIYQ